MKAPASAFSTRSARLAMSTVAPAFWKAAPRSFCNCAKFLIFSGLTPIVTTSRGVTIGVPFASWIGALVAGTRRVASRSPPVSSPCTIAGSQTTRQPLLPCLVSRTVLLYDQGTPPGRVQSSLTVLEAMSPVVFGSPVGVSTSGCWARSPERSRSWVVTSLAATLPPSAPTKPTVLRFPLRQPARKSLSVPSGPSFEHPVRPVATSVSVARQAAARGAVRLRRCGMRSPFPGTP
jgi:hypothetical protein